MRVLLVEDDAATRQVLVAYLRARGHEVEVARCYADAVGRLDPARHAIVLTDLSLTPGGLEGLVLVRHVKTRFPQLPVVVLTAVTAREVMREALVLGASAVLRKPCALSDLVDCLRQVGGSDRIARDDSVNQFVNPW